MVLSTPQTNKAGRLTVTLGLAYAALRAGNVVQARQMLQERITQYPDDADALCMLAEVAAGQQSFEEATMLLRRAVAADSAPERRLALVEHLRRYSGPALALNELEQLPSSVRNRFEVMGIEAGLRGNLGHHDRQIELYQRIARLRSNEPGIWVSLGNALKTVGRTTEAVKALQRAIKVEPRFGETWWTLANFKSFRFSASEMKQMRHLLQGRLNSEDALNIHFALGKAYEDASDWEPSFQHYTAGNALRAQTFSDDQRGVTTLVDQSIAAFTNDFFKRNAGSGFAAPDPIFVLGLHRSGSTLVEQILASHPLVEGTTELAVINALRDRIARSAGLGWPAAIATLEKDRFALLGEEYVEKTRAFRQTDRPYFVDKMPSNWLNIPLIRAALPNAKIVDARRHPMACGFSNFKQNYAMGLGFSYSQETIGVFYQDYWRFMGHIDDVQPGAVHRLINERIIDDPEGEVRRLLDYLELPFDPACLEFYKNERAVRTPSAEQVRKPINREGVDYWRHYEPWLEPLKASLGPALDRWDD
jgi:tetratricopeptide (TPR) repeat protein